MAGIPILTALFTFMLGAFRKEDTQPALKNIGETDSWLDIEKAMI